MSYLHCPNCKSLMVHKAGKEECANCGYENNTNMRMNLLAGELFHDAEKFRRLERLLENEETLNNMIFTMKRMDGLPTESGLDCAECTDSGCGNYKKFIKVSACSRKKLPEKYFNKGKHGQ